MKRVDGPFKVLGVHTKYEYVEVEDRDIIIQVPTRWCGVDQLTIRVSADGIRFVGSRLPSVSLPPSARAKVEGSGFRTFENIIEHEVLNQWNRY